MNKEGIEKNPIKSHVLLLNYNLLVISVFKNLYFQCHHLIETLHYFPIAFLNAKLITVEFFF